MYLCYLDESGTPEIPGTTSHYVLAALSVPVDQWRSCETQIEAIKRKFRLENAEIHVAWMLRPYPEQLKVVEFERLDWFTRRVEVERIRKQEIFDLKKARGSDKAKQIEKNQRKTASYIHLTFDERRKAVAEIARCIASWYSVRLFAECIDKVHFDPVRAGKSTDEQALEQVVSRYERYLQNIDNGYGLLIHDNNQTVAKKHTDLMKRFHQTGTLWTSVQRIVETPLFVDSQLTSMVQLADLCGYALRRYLENNESDLFDLVFQRADRQGQTVVGVRHFTSNACQCKICIAHRRG